MEMDYVWIALGWMAFLAIVVVAITVVTVVLIGRRRSARGDDSAAPSRPESSDGA